MTSTSPLFSLSASRTPAAVYVPTAAFRVSNFSTPAETPTAKAPEKPPLKQRSSKSSKSIPPAPIVNQSTSSAPSVPLKKVLVPIAFGTEEMEAVIIINVLRRAGAAVMVASVEAELEVKASAGTRLVADAFISAYSNECFDLIALPGGMPGSVNLRDCEILKDIMSKHAEEKRLYGAISAAPAVTLLPWGLIKRKKTTCHPAFADRLPTFWAVKSNLQVSGQLTTSRGPGTSFEFAVSLVEQLFGELVAKEVCDSLLLNVADDNSGTEEFNEVSWALDHTPQVMVPVGNGFEAIEVVAIVDILRRAKVNVTVASVEKSLQVLASCSTKIIADKTISSAADSTYDLIILPGGISGVDQLNKSKILKTMLKEQETAGRILGAISSAQAILLRQGLLKEKQTTAHPPSVTSTLNGAQVVIDGKVITSKGLGTATNFALAIVSKFFGQTRARSVAEGLVYAYIPRQ